MMIRIMCKSKIHRATVTEANLEYTGSLTLDAELMRAADLLPYEQIHVLNLTNGARIETYVIEGPAGSGIVCVNGAAAHRMSAGDKVIVISYAGVPDEDCAGFAPKIILVDAFNRIQHVLTEAYQVTPDAVDPGHAFGPRR